MGNCQAAEAATAIIQHPGGKVERLYWPTTAAEVMKSNLGHYVALVTLYVSQSNPDGAGAGGPATVRFTRVKLLKPKDMLLLGQVYRLVTSQEVAKAIRARKDEKKKKSEEESLQNQQQKPQQSSDHRKDSQRVAVIKNRRRHRLENTDQQAQQEAAAAEKPERQRNSTQKARQWRPSLHSISEVGTQSLI